MCTLRQTSCRVGHCQLLLSRFRSVLAVATTWHLGLPADVKCRAVALCLLRSSLACSQGYWWAAVVGQTALAGQLSSSAAIPKLFLLLHCDAVLQNALELTCVFSKHSWQSHATSLKVLLPRLCCC